MPKTVHVYHSDRGWAVQRDGGKSRDVFPTQREAIESARSKARESAPSKYVVHGRNGMIRDVVTYGLPKIQDPPYSKNARRIQRAINELVLERLTSSLAPSRA